MSTMYGGSGQREQYARDEEQHHHQLNHAELKRRVDYYERRAAEEQDRLEAMGGSDEGMHVDHGQPDTDYVDRRVRVLQCIKDPKYPLVAGPGDEDLGPVFEKRGQDLEDILSHEAYMKAPKDFANEKVHRVGVAFQEAHPDYKKEEDVWERRLSLRTLDEAMRGDVSKPMPRPVVFAEDYENYREGRYVKDDCWVA